jgi:predicted GNAT family N-acyltransferase
MRVELFDIRDARRLEEALAIRLRVFVDEQAVPLELEIDEHDRDDPETVHVLVREEDVPAAQPAGKPIATGRFYVLSNGAVQIGRMAVLPEARGRGVGAAILDALLNEAHNRGFREARLDAQTHATAFYRKFGFTDAGKQHWDAGILHQPMSKPL